MSTTGVDAHGTVVPRPSSFLRPDCWAIKRWSVDGAV
jgi:hypothetical protein